MAGAFGYDARHFDVSRAIAERVLIPGDQRQRPRYDRDRRRLLVPHADQSILPGRAPDASRAVAEHKNRHGGRRYIKKAPCSSTLRSAGLRAGDLSRAGALRCERPALSCGAMMNLGITLPFEPFINRSVVELAQHAERLGYTDAWSYESFGAEAFTPLAAAAVVTTKMRFGTAIVPVFTRPPALIAMSAATVQQISGGRFVLGLGISTAADRRKMDECALSPTAHPAARDGRGAARDLPRREGHDGRQGDKDRRLSPRYAARHAAADLSRGAGRDDAAHRRARSATGW